MVPNHQPEYSRNVEDWWKMNKHVSPHSLLPWCLVPSNMSSNNFCRTATSIRPCHWKFQDPKMEVLYHIRPYFLGYIPWKIGQIYMESVPPSSIGSWRSPIRPPVFLATGLRRYSRTLKEALCRPGSARRCPVYPKLAVYWEHDQPWLINWQ